MAPHLTPLTCDDLLHLFHVLPHVRTAGLGPCPSGLHGARRRTHVNIDRERSRSTQRWYVGCSITGVGVCNRSWSRRRPRTHVLVATRRSRQERGGGVEDPTRLDGRQISWSPTTVRSLPVGGGSVESRSNRLGTVE
jgi:hypothetical protein